MKKKILINFIVLLCILFIFEIISFGFAFKYIKTNFQYDNFTTTKLILKSYFTKPDFKLYDVPCIEARNIAGAQYTKRPIVLFGCSVTYGIGLNELENFSGQLSDYTKRPVYNFAYIGWSTQHMLKQLKDNNQTKDINPEPEYFIYTYIHDHRRRLYFFQGWGVDNSLYFKYKLAKKNNNKSDSRSSYLVPVKRIYPFFYRFLTVKFIQHRLEDFLYKNNNRTSELFLTILKESADIIKERYPNAKLIFLYYSESHCSDNEQLPINESCGISEEEKEKITNMGFKIYSIDKIMGKVACSQYYRLPNHGAHPSAKLWEEFIPLFIKTLSE